jgi:hypothetical protein
MDSQDGGCICSLLKKTTPVLNAHGFYFIFYYLHVDPHVCILIEIRIY